MDDCVRVKFTNGQVYRSLDEKNIPIPTQVGDNQRRDTLSEPLEFVFKAKQSTCADA